jgi:hypothetical protein
MKSRISSVRATASQPIAVKLDAMDWWALSVGIAACAVALFVFAADADGAAAAAVLVGASTLVAAALQLKARLAAAN